MRQMDWATSDFDHPRTGLAAHPLLRVWSEYSDLLDADGLADVAALEGVRAVAEAADGIARPAFRAQDAALLAEGLHYETRIAERDQLATRERNAHDLFNALVWLRHPQLKRALNLRQVADIARVGAKQRTRGQCALTHFDEAGAIVWLAKPTLLPMWDAHDWVGLFLNEATAWGSSIAVSVFGHALIEHVWEGRDLPVAKALVVRVAALPMLDSSDGLDRNECSGIRQIQHDPHSANAGGLIARWPAAEACVAAAIAQGQLLADPQELRPLPLAGIPGWHMSNLQAEFFREAPCFRPLRSGRRYPPALHFDSAV